MRNYIKEAIVLAAGLILAGIAVERGMHAFAEKDRSVTVKGLAEKEVMADKVTWPLTYKCLGNDLNSLYDEITRTDRTILDFLEKKGISESEIIINAPEITDLQAEIYADNSKKLYRYNVTSVITVTSDKVELVRNLIQEQSELLKRGIAITSGDYRYRVNYEYTSLNSIKPEMIEEATRNARQAAEKFAEDSDSRLGKIRNASQGQFSISDRDVNTPHIKKVRIVTTIVYSLKN